MESDIPPSFMTTAQAVASLFAWDADEAKSNMNVMECELVARGPNVPVLVVSMPSKSVTASSRKRKAAGGMITVQPIPEFHDGRKGGPCIKCHHNGHEYTRYHGTSSLVGVMEDGFKLKPSGKLDRECGVGPGFFHYAEEQWPKAFGYSGPQTLGEGWQQTPLLRVVCVIKTMCWNVCPRRDWGKTCAGCGRYAITSLRIAQHAHCMGIVSHYDHTEVKETKTFQFIPIHFGPIYSSSFPSSPAWIITVPPPPASSRGSHRLHTTPHRQNPPDIASPAMMKSSTVRYAPF
jgi:hypothetical protein